MTWKTAARIRSTNLTAASLIMALLVGTTSAAGSHVDDAAGLEPGLTSHAGVMTGLDGTTGPRMLEDHFRIEHRAELGRATGLDPVAQAGLLADHFQVEHQSDLGASTGLDPVAQAAWLRDHFQVEHRPGA